MKQLKMVKDWDKILYEAARVLVHEIGHNFYMKHCVYYRCHMNGYNSAEENLEKPCTLCPICLRKLQFSIGFKIRERYEALLKVCKSFKYYKFHNDAEHIERILDGLTEVGIKGSVKVQKKQ